VTTTVTVGDLAARVQRTVNGTRRQPVNYLSGALTSSATNVTFADEVDGITAGSYLGIGEEIVYVRSVNENARTAVIRRAMFNTTAAAHADDSEVQIDWRWFTADVVDAIADEIRSWGDDIFAVTDVDIEVGAADTAVAVSLTGYRFPLELRRSESGRDKWLDVTGTYRVETGLPTSSFSTGNALFLPSSSRGAGTVRLTYATDFDTESITTSTALDDIGLPQSLHDAAMYGASARLLIDREPQRSSVESQPEPRRAADVRAGAAVQMGAAYRQLADQRLADEALRLRARYPIRRV